MSERYITLLGAEDVQRAASTMSSAADDFQRAANQIDGSVQELKRYMDEFILQLTDILKERQS